MLYFFILYILYTLIIYTLFLNPLVNLYSTRIHLLGVNYVIKYFFNSESQNLCVRFTGVCHK